MIRTREEVSSIIQALPDTASYGPHANPLDEAIDTACSLTLDAYDNLRRIRAEVTDLEGKLVGYDATLTYILQAREKAGEL